MPDGLPARDPARPVAAAFRDCGRLLGPAGAFFDALALPAEDLFAAAFFAGALFTAADFVAAFLVPDFRPEDGDLPFALFLPDAVVLGLVFSVGVAAMICLCLTALPSRPRTA